MVVKWYSKCNGINGRLQFHFDTETTVICKIRIMGHVNIHSLLNLKLKKMSTFSFKNSTKITSVFFLHLLLVFQSANCSII